MIRVFAKREELLCMGLFPKYSSSPRPVPIFTEPVGGLLPNPFASFPPRPEGDRCPLLPNAELCKSLRASEVPIILVALSEGDGDSRPNLDGTEAGQGPKGYRAAFEMPLLSKDAGSGASSTERP